MKERIEPAAKMSVVKKLKDKLERHKERHLASDYQFVIAESTHFLNQTDWNLIATGKGAFISANYLAVLERCLPSNLKPQYAIAYIALKPVAIIACQIADISGSNIRRSENDLSEKIAARFRERVIVCGNLASSGLDGVAFSESISEEEGWRITAEAIFRMRKNASNQGKVDFSMIKDVKGERLNPSKILERYSYRKIKTEPDMVLELSSNIQSFDDYHAMLTSKYRSKIRKIIKQTKDAGFECQPIQITPEIENQIHQLYLNVENKSETRLATLPEGYFIGLQQALGERFICYGIKNEDKIVGFISIILEEEKAIAHYVGVDYSVNQSVPIYFRLLQLAIESGIENGVKTISFGRTALEAKASLGAKPVEAFIWVRHRVPAVNLVLRQFFGKIPVAKAPIRNVTKA